MIAARILAQVGYRNENSLTDSPRRLYSGRQLIRGRSPISCANYGLGI